MTTTLTQPSLRLPLSQLTSAPLSKKTSQDAFTSGKTKKIKTANIDKKSLWDKFDVAEGTEKRVDIECVFINSEEKDNCHCCNTALFITEEGFQACSNKSCGVIYKVIDQGAEWRFYGGDDNQSSDPTRCGMPINPLLEQSSYGCKILCPAKSTYEMRKIRRYTEWQSMPYNEKMRYDEGQRISILANQGGIPQMIIDEAMRLHKKISDAKSFRGLNRDGIIAATIYVAARINGYPRSAKEIATIFHLDNTSATRGCRNAISIINELENEMENSEKTSLGQTTPSSFIERYCSHLNINAELTKLCKFIAQKIQKNNLIPENTPNSIASGILYFVAQKCNLNVSKRSVHNVSDVSEVTINKCFKKLEELQDQLIPKVIIDKYNK
jgi:transcription initiation factor TFIIB|uniref:Cyclin-like domain-containing protein n=1 Tax=viral metagenome TaxID=1070528 RepID=A0A6C0HZC4_9ZZZZ